jgi:hypothetical protein
MFICTTKTYVSDARGNIKVYRPGVTVPIAVYQKFNTIQKAKFTKKPTDSRHQYTIEEFNAMAEVYMKLSKTESPLECYWDEFLRAVPDTNANREGVICYFCIIRGYDNSSSYTGFNNPAKELAIILEDIDPKRFGSDNNVEDKIDALLATI